MSYHEEPLPPPVIEVERRRKVKVEVELVDCNRGRATLRVGGNPLPATLFKGDRLTIRLDVPTDG